MLLTIHDAGKPNSQLNSISRLVSPYSHKIVMIDCKQGNAKNIDLMTGVGDEMKWHGWLWQFGMRTMKMFDGCIMKKRLTGPPVNQLLPKFRDNISSLSASFPPTKLSVVKKTFSCSFLHFPSCLLFLSLQIKNIRFEVLPMPSWSNMDQTG